MASLRNPLRDLVKASIAKSTELLIDFKANLIAGREFNVRDFDDASLWGAFHKSLQLENIDFLFYVSVIRGDSSLTGFSDLKKAYQLEAGYQLMKKNESKRIMECLPDRVLFFKGFVLSHLLG